MPEKPLTVATYAAGASLAAIALVYVFAPTYLIDNEEQANSGGILPSLTGRRKGIVGLTNQANDCFINSVLQALAGLGDLRLYLIRETHRRTIDDVWVYAEPVPEDVSADGDSDPSSPQSPHRAMPAWKIEGLQKGIVTKGLKEMLDQLNERPIYKKTTTAVPFVRVLETAFRQRISRQQQDAQEFLQVVAERVCDEYHAGQKARKYAKQKARLDQSAGGFVVVSNGENGERPEDEHAAREGSPEDLAGSAFSHVPAIRTTDPVAEDADDEDGFPMEGAIASQIECLTCGFKPRPSEQTFCTLTLNVPHASSTTLNACFDGMFKTEYIDDFKCEKCRLVHARDALQQDLAKSTSAPFIKTTKEAIEKLTRAIENDPENAPEDVAMPDARYAPRRRIARHIRLTRFPKIMAVHLSRSIYDSSHSTKNVAKVAFPERLPLGGLLQQKKYKLLGMVTHKGSHNTGHYESFRRQNTYAPYSNPSTFQQSGIYSKTGSPAGTPRLRPEQQASASGSPLASTPDLTLPSRPGSSTTSLEHTLRSPASQDSVSFVERPSTSPMRGPGPTSAPREKDVDGTSLRSITRSTLSKIASSRSGSRNGTPNGAAAALHPEQQLSPTSAPPAALAAQKTPIAPEPSRSKRRRHTDRWWRVSDEKVKEASTRDVLGMQKEVYLLFYELEREP